MSTAADVKPVSGANPTWTAFDQLDTLVRVTTVQGWVYLAVLFAVGAGSIAFAFLYQVPTKVNGEGLLLTERDALVRVRAGATGRIASLRARLGDWVDAGTEIGRIAQNDYLMPSLRRLLIDHARLGKMFYRYPTTDTMQHTLESAVVQHDQIIDALERQDADAAGQLVRDHFELSRRRMTEYAAPQGMAVSVNLGDPVLAQDKR